MSHSEIQPSTAHPGFVGRERELSELRGGLERAWAGEGGSLFLLVGEPGIGKTRLAGELAADATGLGARVAVGRCWEGAGAPPYWPWVQVIRSFARDLTPKTLAARLGAGGPDIAQIVPELRERLPSMPAPASPESEESRFRLFDSVTNFLGNMTAAEPLALIFDDLHAADRPSLLLLLFVARELRESRILLIGTYREVEARLKPPISALLGDLAREGRHLPLRGLSEADVGRLIEVTAGAPPDKPLVTKIHQTTEGNPFFVDEVVRLLAAEGRLAEFHQTGPLEIPAGVREAIRRRVSGLSDEASRVLEIAAVVGRVFELDVLEGVAKLPRTRLLGLLDDAIAIQAVAELRASARYSFTHDLVHQTLYESLSRARREGLHQEIALALEDLRRADLEPYVAEIAHHYVAAAPAADPSKAVEYAARAGDRAAGMLAYEEAADHYGNALQAGALLPSRNEERECELLLRMGDVQWRAGGEMPAAKESFRQAAAIARGLGAPEHLARAALGYAVGLGGYFHEHFADRETLDLLEEALRAIGDEDSIMRVRLLARLASELYPVEVERRAELSQAAVETARRLTDPVAQVVALYGRHWATVGPDTLEERLANAGEMLRLADEIGDEEAEFLGHHFRFYCLLEIGDVRGVEVEVDACDRLAERLRQPYYLWRTRCLQASKAILDGRYERAERIAEDALRIGRQRQYELATILFGAQMYGIRWAQGRVDEMEEEVSDFHEQYPWIPRWRVAFLVAEVGAEARTRAEIERHAANGFRDLRRDGLWILHLCSLAHACAAVGDSDRAGELYDLLLPYAARNAISLSDQSFGSVSLRLGLLAATMGRREEAEGHFESALRFHERLGARALVGITLYEWARALASPAVAGDAPRILDLLERAQAVCEDLGMTGRLERISTLRIQVESARLDAAGVGGLGEEGAVAANIFRREGEYWTISYAGETVRMKDARGLRDLASLLACPGKEIHVTDLVAPGAPPDPRGERHRGMSARELADSGLRPAGFPEGDAPLDPRAREEYRRRLGELQEEIDEAEPMGDTERAGRAREEMDFIAGELASAYGLGGRERRPGDSRERARKAVTERIRHSVARIEQAHPSLGRHLTRSIHTGAFCRYDPDPPITWAT